MTNANNNQTNVVISKAGSMYFVEFFNSTEVYHIDGFYTERKARNFCKKYGYNVIDELPAGVSKYQSWS